ncbi:MAG: hypothetical protein LBH75_03265 [Treponema sp.]|nr:hypothetical protein [Treponema sp.]
MDAFAEANSAVETVEIREEKIAVERYRWAEQIAQDAKNAGLIDKEERIKQVNTALETQYVDMEAIVTEYRLISGATIDLRNETVETLKSKEGGSGGAGAGEARSHG